jgi:ferredoxin
MREIGERLRQKARQLLRDGVVGRVWAWRGGDFFYDNAPASADSVEECDELVYNEFCPANLSKYLMQSSRQGVRAAVFLKPCDTYGVNQLLQDHRVKRELVYAVGTPCSGMLDIKKLRAAAREPVLQCEVKGDEVLLRTVSGEQSLPKQELLLDKCLTCKGNAYKIVDEELCEPLPTPSFSGNRFAVVKALERLSAEERFRFWQQELSRCIRCNACRDVCPACSCEQCVFDNPQSPVAGKAAADTVEEQLFHIIRAYHVAGRCVGCGECARVCPQGIRLGLLNMKFMKDINSFFGAYQAGEDAETPAPLVSYRQDDPEAEAALAEMTKGGGAHV